tara:strand:- start:5098 stop:5868 length:771 start_codon:yes stop_codon:yes gene_type:complete
MDNEQTEVVTPKPAQLKSSFRTSESLGAIAGALATARGEMDKLLKGAENPFFKSKYADLAACLDVAIPHLSKNKIACIQGTNHLESGAIEVSTRLIHGSGEWLETSVTLKPVKFDPQGVGSAISYGRRYCVSSLLSLSAEDDDGNEATQPLPQSARQQPAKKQAPAPKQEDEIDMSPPKKKVAPKKKASKEVDTTPAGEETQKALAASILEAKLGAERIEKGCELVSVGRTNDPSFLTTEESVEMMGMIEKMKGAE